MANAVRCRLSLLAAGLAAAIVCAACGSGGGSDGSGGSATESLTVAGYQPTTVVFSLQAADALGYNKKYGVDVTLNVVPSANQLPLLLRGDIDLMCISGTFYGALLQGNDQLVTVMAAGVTQPYVLVANGKHTTIDSLKGATIGTAGTGTTLTYVLLSKLLQQHGIGTTDVRYVSMTNESDRASALLGGRIDATLLSPDSAAVVQGHAGINVLDENIDRTITLRPYLTCFTTRADARRKGEALKRFVTAQIATARSLNDDESAYTRMIARYEGDSINPAQARKLWQLMRDLGFYSVNGGLDKNSYLASVRFYSGIYQEPMPSRQLLDGTFSYDYVRAALDKLHKVPSQTDPADWYGA